MVKERRLRPLLFFDRAINILFYEKDRKELIMIMGLVLVTVVYISDKAGEALGHKLHQIVNNK